MPSPYTNKPVYNTDGSVPANYYGEDYWEHGDEKGLGSYNGNDYANNLDLCKYWAKDCYTRWGPFRDFLELGCGRGWNIWGFLRSPELGVNPLGVDFSHYAIETTVDEIKPYIIEHDASDLSFLPDSSRDVIFSNDFMEHLTPVQVYNCLRHCARIARQSIVHLISIGDGEDHSLGPLPEQDQSHVTMRSVFWWHDLFRSVFGDRWMISSINHGTTVEIVVRLL